MMKAITLDVATLKAGDHPGVADGSPYEGQS
jgi:hypothetical protein